MKKIFLLVTLLTIKNTFAQNPSLVSDLVPGSVGSFPYGMIKASPNTFLLFNDSEISCNLWRTNGTPGGTVLLKQFSDTYPTPRDLTTLPNMKAVFAAPDVNSGMEAWVTDGSSAGTFLLKDINPGSHSSGPKFGDVLNGKLFFIAKTEGVDWVTGSYSLWVTDGSVIGTKKLADSVNTGNGYSPIYHFTYVTYKNVFYFYGFNAVKDEHSLWRSDGTVSGTFQVKILNKLGNLDQKDIIVYNNNLFFRGYDVLHGEEVWKSNGTFAGTKLLKDINPGSSGSLPTSFTTYNGKLYFISDNGTDDFEIWSTDGTKNGTKQVSNMSTPMDDEYAQINGVAGPYLYFTAGYTEGAFRSDGTLTGTIPLNGLGITDLTEFMDTAFLNMEIGGFAVDLDAFMKTDGTPEGTTSLLCCGGDDPDDPSYSQFTEINGALYLTGGEGSSLNLYKYKNGLVELIDLDTTVNVDMVSILLKKGKIIYMQINKNGLGKELWKLDTSIPIELKEIDEAAEHATGNESAFIIYPNPNSGFINLDFRNPHLINSSAVIVITDLLGKIVWREEMQILNSQYSLKLPGNIPNGQYLLTIESVDQTSRQSFLLQR
jgi:ELWxxDGT repeat protein